MSTGSGASKYGPDGLKEKYIRPANELGCEAHGKPVPNCANCRVKLLEMMKK